MASVYEIIKGIHQAAANAQDHAYGGSEAGLKREEGHKIHDARVVDGFKVTIGGNLLGVTYQAQTTLEQTHENKYEEELKSMLDQIAKFLKKEYKKITGDTLTLKEHGDLEAVVQQTSNVRVFVTAKQYYEISGIDVDDNGTDEREKEYNKIDRMLEESYDPYLAWQKHLGREE